MTRRSILSTFLCLTGLIVFVALTLSVSPVSAQDGGNWPQFRGPSSSGVSDGPPVPLQWSQTENVVWRVEVPGRGWSSPIVWEDRIFVTSAIRDDGTQEEVKKGLYFGGERPAPQVRHRWIVRCLDWNTGRTLWENTAHEGIPEHGHHLKNTFASETPVTDGERVYAYFGNVGLFCYDMQGMKLWSRNWGSFPTKLGWGTAASPVVHGGRVYVVVDNEEDSFLAILDAIDGQELRRIPRNEKTNWATPVIWQNPLRTELVVPGAERVRSYDLEGELLWELGGMSSLTIPTPVTVEDLLILSSGYVLDKRKPLIAVRPGGEGDITPEKGKELPEAIAWFQEMAGPYNPSPLAYRGLVYVLYDRGFFACYDGRTGEEVYSKRRIGEGANAFTASPVGNAGRVFCLSEDGDMYVFKAGADYEILAKNSLDEFCMSTPAILRGNLLIRSESHLYRIGQQKQNP